MPDTNIEKIKGVTIPEIDLNKKSVGVFGTLFAYWMTSNEIERKKITQNILEKNPCYMQRLRLDYCSQNPGNECSNFFAELDECNKKNKL